MEIDAINLVLKNKDTISSKDVKKIDELRVKYESGKYIFVRLETTKLKETLCIVYHKFVSFDEILKDIVEHQKGVFGVMDDFYTFALISEVSREELKMNLPMYLPNIYEKN